MSRTPASSMCNRHLEVLIPVIRDMLLGLARAGHSHAAFSTSHWTLHRGELDVRHLPPTQCAAKIHGTHKPAIAIRVCSASLGNQGALGEVVTRPTCKYENLKSAGL